MMARSLIAVALLAAAAGGAGCHTRLALTTPASDQVAYASAYPERLRALRARFVEAEEQTRESFTGLRALPGAAPATEADEVEQLVRRADAAGRSQHYVEEALRQEEIGALMRENRSAIRRRVAGSVAFAAKEKECAKEEVDALASAAALGTDRAVERQLEERLRARNSAHRYLRARADELGERRVNALEKQVDALTRASFVANVRLALYRAELDDALAQEKAIATTLERDEAEGRAALGAATLSRSHRRALEEQVAQDEAARRELPTEVAASQSAQKDLEARAQQLQKDYQALLDQLLAELAARQREAATAPARDSTKASGAGAKTGDAKATQSNAAGSDAAGDNAAASAPEAPMGPPPPEPPPASESGGAPEPAPQAP